MTGPCREKSEEKAWKLSFFSLSLLRKYAINNKVEYGATIMFFSARSESFLLRFSEKYFAILKNNATFAAKLRNDENNSKEYAGGVLHQESSGKVRPGRVVREDQEVGMDLLC